jgi:hypothetical protein
VRKIVEKLIEFESAWKVREPKLQKKYCEVKKPKKFCEKFVKIPKKLKR